MQLQFDLWPLKRSSTLCRSNNLIVVANTSTGDISDYPLTLGVARLVNCWSHTHLRIKSVICKVHFIHSYSQIFPHPKIVDLKRLFRDLTSAVLWEGSSVGSAGFFWCEKHWPSLCNTWVACSIFAQLELAAISAKFKKRPGIYVYIIKPRRQLRTWYRRHIAKGKRSFNKAVFLLLVAVSSFSSALTEVLFHSSPRSHTFGVAHVHWHQGLFLVWTLPAGEWETRSRETCGYCSSWAFLNSVQLGRDASSEVLSSSIAPPAPVVELK